MWPRLLTNICVKFIILEFTTIEHCWPETRIMNSQPTICLCLTRQTLNCAISSRKYGGLNRLERVGGGRCSSSPSQLCDTWCLLLPGLTQLTQHERGELCTSVPPSRLSPAKIASINKSSWWRWCTWEARHQELQLQYQSIIKQRTHFHTPLTNWTVPGGFLGRKVEHSDVKWAGTWLCNDNNENQSN